MLGHAQLSTTTSVLSVRRPDAASKLLRCSGAAVTSSAWPLARRGRCGPCTALMTQKVEEGRRRCACLCSGVQVRRPAAHSLSYLPLHACMYREISVGGSHCATPTEKCTQEGFFPRRNRSCGTKLCAPITTRHDARAWKTEVRPTLGASGWDL